MFTRALSAASTGRDRRALIGREALAADVPPEAARLEVIRRRLPGHEWPDRDLRVVVVDAETGEPQVVDRRSGVGLVEAVAASCAVPSVWPPVTLGGQLGGRRYIDGGIRPGSNADVAADHEVVLVLAPMMETAGFFDPQIGAALDELLSRPDTLLISPDEASAAAGGPDPLDPDTWPASARAGYEQAREVVETVRKVWR